MANGPQLDSGGGGDEEEQQDGTMAESDIEREADRLTGAQDRDTREVQRRERQTAGADGPQRAARSRTPSDSVGGGDQPTTSAEGGAVDVEAVERAASARRTTGATTSAAGGAFDVERIEQRAETQERRAARAAERSVREQTGRDVDLTRDDVRITQSGGVELTQAGVDKAATQPLTDFVSDVEGRGTESLTSAAGVVGIDERVEFDVPGEGPVVEGVGVERDLGDVPIRVRPGPEDEFTTLEEVLGDIQERIFEATEPETGAFARRYVDEDQIQTEGFTEAEERRQAFAGGAASGIARTPAFIVGGVGLAKDTVDVGTEITGAVARGDFDRVDEIIGDVEQATLNIGAQSAATAIESPLETAGAATGSLVGTGLLFGGAAAVGSRTSLTTRALIQPGEEIAGYGLNLGARGAGRAVGRPEGGRRVAETIAPNKEPLIFSEEAFLRGVRGVGERVAPRAATARTRAVDIALGKPETTVEYDATRFDPIQRTTGRPGLSTRVRRGARRVDDAFSGRVFAGIPIPKAKVETETRARPSTEAETDVLLDELEGPLRRMEEARIREVQRADRIGEPAGRPTEFRVKDTKPTVETELQGAETRIRRAETAIQDQEQFLSEVLDVDQQLSEDLDLGQEGGVDIRQDIETDTETRQETDTETETETETEVEFLTEVEQEQKQEQEVETEFETESEFELEFEAFRFEDEPAGEPRQDRRLGLFDRELAFERDLSFIEEIEDDLDDDLEDLDL